MSVRPEVLRFVAFGRLPAESDATLESMRKLETALEPIKGPLSDDEARLICRVFGPDDCFGCAWTLLHLVETAPSWPIRDCLDDDSREWIRRLKDRARRGGYCV
jgi:hypothetical protein